MLLGLLGLMLTIDLAWQWYVPLPFCLLRHFTGIPCPFCGSTRCLLALAHLEFTRALRFNPLVFLGCVAVAGTFGLWFVGRLLRRPIRINWWDALLQKPGFYIFALLIGLNWLYLVFALPR